MKSKKEIAEERIKELFRFAELELRNNNSIRVRRYIVLARKIGMKCQYTLPRELKRKFCKKCSMLLLPEISCSAILNQKTGIMEVKCFNCNNIKRYTYDGQDKR